MSRRLKILFLLLLLFATSIALLQLLPVPRYQTQDPNINNRITVGNVAEGKRIALTICGRCHYNEKTGTLSGKQQGNPTRLGDFSSGNITLDIETGIGKWTPGQLYYFLKTGIKPDGAYVFDMPKYPNLSEVDIMSIIAFLRSNDSLVHKTDARNPNPKFSLLTKFLLQTAIHPPLFKDSIIAPPDTGNTLLFGKYLATAKFSCYECHSLNMVTTNYNVPEKSWGFFKGGNPHANEQREKILSANITGDSIYGIGRWTEDQFVLTLKNGIKPDGKTVRDPMFPFYLLTDQEAKAIYIYLKTL